MKPHWFADAAFADDLKTSKSISGAYLTLRTQLATSGVEEFAKLTTDFPLGCSSSSQSWDPLLPYQFEFSGQLASN